jgi:hypothetical protein
MPQFCCFRRCACRIKFCYFGRCACRVQFCYFKRCACRVQFCCLRRCLCRIKFCYFRRCTCRVQFCCHARVSHYFLLVSIFNSSIPVCSNTYILSICSHLFSDFWPSSFSHKIVDSIFMNEPPHFCEKVNNIYGTLPVCLIFTVF